MGRKHPDSNPSSAFTLSATGASDFGAVPKRNGLPVWYALPGLVPAIGSTIWSCMNPFAGRKIETVNAQLRLLAVGQRQAGGIALHRVSNAGRNGAEQFRQRKIRDHRVIYIEQKFQPIAFAHNLLLQFARFLIVQRVLNRHRHLRRNHRQNRQARWPVRVALRTPQVQRSDFASRAGQGKTAKRFQSVLHEHAGRSRKTAGLLGFTNDERPLRPPHFSGRRIVHAELHAGMDRRHPIEVQGVHPHHLVLGIVKNETQIIEIQNRVQTAAEIFKQLGQSFGERKLPATLPAEWCTDFREGVRSDLGAWPCLHAAGLSQRTPPQCPSRNPLSISRHVSNHRHERGRPTLFAELIPLAPS